MDVLKQATFHKRCLKWVLILKLAQTVTINRMCTQFKMACFLSHKRLHFRLLVSLVKTTGVFSAALSTDTLLFGSLASNWHEALRCAASSFGYHCFQHPRKHSKYSGSTRGNSKNIGQLLSPLSSATFTERQVAITDTFYITILDDRIRCKKGEKKTSSLLSCHAIASVTLGVIETICSVVATLVKTI